MSSLSRELVFLTLQFLDEEKFEKTVHKLEQESGYFFNMKYFEDEVHNGNWDEVEKYLSGFTKVDDNRYSMKIFFEIRKQKYLEALDKHDRPRAVDILVNDLKIFASYNEDLFKEITQLLTLENFRENQQLSKYSDAKSARAIMLVEIKKLIEANPLFRDKLQFPNLKNSRLRTLINQSLNWQHQLCKNPKPNPDIKTLFTDHSCSLPRGVSDPSLVSNPLSQPGNFPSLETHMPSLAPVSVSPAGWMVNPPAFPVVPGGAIGLSTLTVPATILKRPKTPQTSNVTTKHSSADSDFASKSIGITDKMTDELPKTVARTLNQGSSPTSMDFHPTLHTLLLVGTSAGDIGIWDVGTREKLVHRNFKIVVDKDPIISVNSIKWSPDGSLFGVAYSRHIVQIYSYMGHDAIRQQLEIDAHIGGVNDIAFAQPEKQLCVITCGDDKLIKVWDTVSGAKQYTFEGHEAPVYSVCPQHKDNIQFIFSTSVDGKIKAWLYDNIGSRIDHDAPGHWCTTMAYSADGSRLFSCGTSNEGHSYLVEWNECEGALKRTYNGFNKSSEGVVQFDTTKNRFLAAGDEFVIKVWDMDSVNLLTTIDADGGLRARPLVRFNKEGSLMAVSAHENVIKILANEDGLCLLRTSENYRCDSSKTVTENITKNGDCGNLMNIKPRINEEMTDKSNMQKLTENVLARCRSLRLMGDLIPCKISRLMYANSGTGILALASNATHFLWKLPRSHPGVKAMVCVTPKVWQPSSGIFMKNDISITNPGESVSCFALSNNDCYVISASGGTISLFNMATFERMTTFMPTPPAATSLAFHPEDNNIIAIGMDDSTIHIYNVNVDEVKTKFRGHSKRITGLAFSSSLRILVSSGADSQINVWGTDGWNKLRSKALQIPSCRSPTTKSDLQIQFHRNQIHFLAVHETQIALYDANNLDCMEEWIPGDGYTPISHAVFSCDSQLVYACFVDATVCVFDASNLKLNCRIDPTSYLTANVSLKISATVIAAHPLERNQIAVGLTDGSVHILEPLEPKGNWGASADSGSACSSQLTESSTSQN